jgi:hypothetical protein
MQVVLFDKVAIANPLLATLWPLRCLTVSAESRLGYYTIHVYMLLSPGLYNTHIPTDFFHTTFVTICESAAAEHRVWPRAGEREQRMSLRDRDLERDV